MKTKFYKNPYGGYLITLDTVGMIAELGRNRSWEITQVPLAQVKSEIRRTGSEEIPPSSVDKDLARELISRESIREQIESDLSSKEILTKIAGGPKRY